MIPSNQILSEKNENKRAMLLTKYHVDPNRKDANDSGLRSAAFHGDFKAVEFFVLVCQADINAKRELDGRTAMHTGCNSGVLDVIKFLILNGGSHGLYTPDENNVTAYDIIKKNKVFKFQVDGWSSIALEGSVRVCK